MQQARRGDTVRVHYTGKFEDGSVFDSSAGGDPLEFTIGAEQVIPADRGYGTREEKLVFQVGRDQLPDGTDVEIGDTLRVGFADGQTAAVQVMDFDQESLTLDANHPLAGRTLVFELELVGIQ
jgi:peptidylprolyl isomerase